MLSASLRQMAESHLEAIQERLHDFDDVVCVLILIEAVRVIDYENVLMGSSADESHHLPYPEFDIMCRAWNPLMSCLLPRLPKLVGIPIQESTPESRSRARSLLHAFGKCAVLQKAADMARHGLIVGTEIENILSLRMTFAQDSDHFLDQLEDEKLEAVLNGDDAEKQTPGRLSREEVDELVASLVFPFETGHGTMVGYDADPRLDAHFIELVGERTMKWRTEAGIHPGVQASGLDGADVAAVALMLISFYLKHIWFVGVGSKRLEGINYCMSLTIWKKPEDLVDSIAGFTGISVERVKAALKAVLVTKDDAGYFSHEGTPFMPLLLEISDGYWLAPVSSIFRNPLQAIRMLNEHRFPSIGPSIRAPREEWMISDLCGLFQGNRYQVVDTPTRLKRNNVTITDIDAAILDKTTGELALFQLKWQDFGSNLLRKIRSRAKNFVDQVSTWANHTDGWIEEFGEAELCRSLRLKLPKGASLTGIRLFAIGKSNARFASYGYDLVNPKLAACNWDQFVRLRYEIGPADIVFSEIHARILSEKSRGLDRKPLPCSIEVGDMTVRFEDMWSTSE